MVAMYLIVDIVIRFHAKIDGTVKGKLHFPFNSMQHASVEFNNPAKNYYTTNELIS